MRWQRSWPVMLLTCQAVLLGCGRVKSEQPAVAGSGGAAPVDDDAERSSAWQSGSRLRARIQDAGGGATLFESWVDTKLGADCAFTRTSDGGVHCLPALNGEGADQFFADSACTQAVAALTTLSILGSDPPPKPDSGAHKPYFSALTTTCEVDTPVTVQEAQGEPVLQVPFVKTGGLCQPFTGPLGAQFQGWLGTLVDSDLKQFVAAQEVIDPSTKPLVARVLRAEDGSRENAGLTDQTHAQACTPLAAQSTMPLATTCIPNYAALVTPTASVCPTVLDANACATCPKVGLNPIFHDATSNPRCTVEFETFSLAPGAPTIQDGCPKDSTGQLCSNLLPMPDNTYPAAGTKQLGSARLSSTLYTDAAGRPVVRVPHKDSILSLFGLPLAPAAFFFDTQLGTTCALVTEGAAAGRCLPLQIQEMQGTSPVYDLIAFSDPTCTTQIYLSGSELQIPCDGKMWLATREGKLYPLGATLWINQWYTGTPSACTPTYTPSVVPYALGPVLNVSDLPSITETVE